MPSNGHKPSVPSVGSYFEAVLKRHVVNAWFPRSLDHEYGGFLCDFDCRWRSCGPNEKLLEFQARQTWFAAEACRCYPQNKYLLEGMKHGFSHLRHAFWDKSEGGWFHRLDRAGHPIQSHTKHAH